MGRGPFQGGDGRLGHLLRPDVADGLTAGVNGTPAEFGNGLGVAVLGAVAAVLLRRAERVSA
ncbi:hypothetical protein STPH2_3973 [Streptomyces sp. KO7888]|nr:hypothetical protein [Streptomyces sp. KO7888]